MSRVCQITGKRPMTGNTVSHANNRRRRRFLPNLHVQRFWLESERRFVSLRVSTRGLRTIEKKGIEVVVRELRNASGIEADRHGEFNYQALVDELVQVAVCALMWAASEMRGKVPPK